MLTAKLTIGRSLWWLWAALSALLVLTFGNSGHGAAAGSKEMVYVSGYDKLFAIDPSTRELIAEIPVRGANRDMTWPTDGSRLYVNSEGRQTVTVVDTKTNKVVERLTYNTDQYVARIYGLAVDPKGEKLYATLMRTQKEKTELKALPPVIQVMDLASKKVVKEITVPWGTHALQFFTSGDKLAVWAKDLYVYDLRADKLELYRPIMNPPDGKEGYGNYLYFWGRDADSQNLSTAVLYKLFPDTGKVAEGLFLLDLASGDTKEVLFKEEPLGLFSGVVAPDKKTAYVGMNFLAKVDLETGKHQKVVPNAAGTSYGFNLSADGKTVYVSGAGPDISFYNAQTLELEKTIQLSSDTMDVRVVKIPQ